MSETVLLCHPAAPSANVVKLIQCFAFGIDDPQIQEGALIGAQYADLPPP